MSYNLTAFKNNPELAQSSGTLYVLVLVNTKTAKRECIKIGITKGSSYKAVKERAKGFRYYEHRVQTIVRGTLLYVYNLEQMLHEKYKEYRYIPKEKFGGHTECFSIEILSNVLVDLKNRV